MKRRRAFFGGLLGGLAGALLAPRLRASRLGAPWQLLRATLGLRGASRSFAGTPCSQELRATGDDVADAARSPETAAGERQGWV
jgi:hypothetical protein